eukprot:CAMPEP_0170561538 /NCGR_PEP_ID=MMETSP0211-20121228/55367_1 /TAXON_ID=311385 /ORGANISM="Pseudokeronopsis sp., Strain OXSARD2" /LENGTH=75 /DNA_ID=CAMNT_0010877209 /DNA_START=357 /DNA_END=584 /DNA_ORIENTATION=+
MGVDTKGALKLNLEDMTLYSVRMAKKKNGKPDMDFGAVDPMAKLMDVNFEHYCVMYKTEALLSDGSLVASVNSNR